MIRAVRGFFDGQGFYAVETPALQVMPAADMHIHGFRTEYFGADLRPQRKFYLHTSPEFAMKKLLVAGCEKIYQICNVFRNGESTRLHSPEFALLEWYRAGADYRDIMDDCVHLLRHVAAALKIDHFQTAQGQKADPYKEWQFISVAEAFAQYAGLELDRYLEDKAAFAAAIAEAGIRVAPDDAWDDLFFRVMAEKIEPYLGFGAPTILYNYPSSMASLSRKSPENSRYAERFELYVCGIELANAFSELTDTKEQRARFTQEMLDKQALYGFSYPLDEDFLAALECGLPESGGIALGLDRLAMLCCGAERIDDVLWTGKP